MNKINYKWIALSCTTLGALFSVLSGSTLIVALPVIMRDLHASMTVITWTIMGYMLIMTILVPSIGRMGDMYGRKKLYVSGFAVFTACFIFVRIITVRDAVNNLSVATSYWRFINACQRDGYRC